MNTITLKIFIAVLLIGNLSLLNAQCLPNGITFSSQSEIDDFAIDYPDCIEILGDVEITGPITNLNGLAQIVSVNGSLNIHETSLINLEGLNNLTTITGNLKIFNNSNIQNTNGVEDLNLIQGELEISGNSSLSAITSFENITSLGDGIYPGNALTIWSNTMLLDIQSLSNIQTLNGNFEIHGTALTNFDALANMESILGRIEIKFNGILTNIDGLQAVNPSEIKLLRITQNHSLSECSINNICEYLNMPSRSVDIQQNANGCSSITQVEDNCVLSIEDNPFSQLKLFPNPTYNTFEISGLNEGNVEIIDSPGRTVKQMNIGEKEYSISDLSTGVYFIKITSENSSVTKRLVKL